MSSCRLRPTTLRGLFLTGMLAISSQALGGESWPIEHMPIRHTAYIPADWSDDPALMADVQAAADFWSGAACSALRIETVNIETGPCSPSREAGRVTTCFYDALQRPERNLDPGTVMFVEQVAPAAKVIHLDLDASVQPRERLEPDTCEELHDLRALLILAWAELLGLSEAAEGVPLPAEQALRCARSAEAMGPEERSWVQDHFGPSAALQVEPTVCAAPCAVALTATSELPVSGVQWEPEEGGSVEGQTAEYVLSEAGEYTVRAVMTGEDASCPEGTWRTEVAALSSVRVCAANEGVFTSMPTGERREGVSTSYTFTSAAIPDEPEPTDGGEPCVETLAWEITDADGAIVHSGVGAEWSVTFDELGVYDVQLHVTGAGGEAVNRQTLTVGGSSSRSMIILGLVGLLGILGLGGVMAVRGKA